MSRTFSQDAKNELLRKEISVDCCALAGLCAIIHSNGSLELKKNRITFSLLTENVELLGYVGKILKRFFGEDATNFTKKTIKQIKSDKFEMIFPTRLGVRILTDCGVLRHEQGNLVIEQGINKHLVMEECCKLAYLASSFAGTGTISLPGEKKNSGYHMEWALSNEKQARDISHLLGELGVVSGKVERGDKFIVYVKESESISFLLGKFGAIKSFLEIESEKTNREMRNKINRQANCISANISKSVEAGIRQTASIETIEKTVGLRSLPKQLQEVALLRKKNPHSSLSELEKSAGGKVSKSTIRFRLGALEKIAKDLSGE